MITQSAECAPRLDARHNACSGFVTVTASTGVRVRTNCTCECHAELRRRIRELIDGGKS